MELRTRLGNLVSWMQEKTQLVKKSYETNIFVPTKKGEIFLCDLGTNIGIEIDKIRPALVWQNPKIRNYHGVIVIPLTSTIKDEHLSDRRYVIVSDQDLEFGRLQTTSRVLTDQIRTISKLRIHGKIRGKLNKQALVKIEQAIRFTLHL